MDKKLLYLVLVGLMLNTFLVQRAEAGGLIKLKKLAKIGLLAHALSGKKILLPLPLPLPIPLLKENVHPAPYPVHHHSTAVVGYGYEHGHHGHHGQQGWW